MVEIKNYSKTLDGKYDTIDVFYHPYTVLRMSDVSSIDDEFAICVATALKAAHRHFTKEELNMKDAKIVLWINPTKPLKTIDNTKKTCLTMIASIENR